MSTRYRWLRVPLRAATTICRLPDGLCAAISRCRLLNRLCAAIPRCPLHKVCGATFILSLLLPGPLLAGEGVTLRDPFAPPALARCELQAAERLGWQLQGVIGQPGEFHAWLVAPPATRLRLRAGETLPGTRWQVVEIARFSITLGADNGCPPPLRLALKERNRGQTTNPTAAAGAGAQRSGAG